MRSKDAQKQLARMSLIYTSELILCSTTCVHSTTWHSIHMSEEDLHNRCVTLHGNQDAMDNVTDDIFSKDFLECLQLDFSKF